MYKKFRRGEGDLLTNFQSFISFNLDHGRYHVLWEADNKFGVNVEAAMKCRNSLISLPDFNQLRPLFQETESRFASTPWLGSNGLDQFCFVHAIYFREDDSGYRSFEISALGHTSLRIFTGLKDLQKDILVEQFHAEFDCYNLDLHELYKRIVKGV